MRIKEQETCLTLHEHDDDDDDDDDDNTQNSTISKLTCVREVIVSNLCRGACSCALSFLVVFRVNRDIA